MHITYRLFDGSMDDAAGILEVEAACWNEATHSPQTLRELLQSVEQVQVCWLAEACGQVVGFAHAFLTYRGRYATWELDLLAVHPNWRRRARYTFEQFCQLPQVVDTLRSVNELRKRAQVF